MDVLGDAAGRSPDAVAVGGAGAAETRTYRELDRDADAVAGWLAERTEGGETVAMRLAPGPLSLAVLHGAWRAGRTLAPLGTA